MRKVCRETTQKVAAVFGPLGTVLLEFNDIPANVLVGLDKGGIDSGGNS